MTVDIAAIAVSTLGCAVSERVDVVRSRIGGWWWTHARLPVQDQNGHCHSPRGLHGLELQRFILALALALVSAVLEPDFYLRGGEL